MLKIIRAIIILTFVNASQELEYIYNNPLCGSYSAKLGGSSRNGLEQTVTGLSPNTTYTLQAQCKVSTSGVTGSVGIKNFGGTTITRSFTSTTYTAKFRSKYCGK